MITPEQYQQMVDNSTSEQYEEGLAAAKWLSDDLGRAAGSKHGTDLFKSNSWVMYPGDLSWDKDKVVSKILKDSRILSIVIKEFETAGWECKRGLDMVYIRPKPLKHKSWFEELIEIVNLNHVR